MFTHTQYFNVDVCTMYSVHIIIYNDINDCNYVEIRNEKGVTRPIGSN